MSSLSTIGAGRSATAAVLEHEPAEVSAVAAHEAPAEVDHTKSMLQSQATLTQLATVITNLANMRHEMLKAVAQNLRA